MTGKTPSVRKAHAGRLGIGDAADVIPLRYGDDPYVWACWLYYEDGLTQGEIADVMGISRATVNSYLADARDKGIVQITIEPARLASLRIAEALKRQFGLDDVYILPGDDESRPLIDRLGVAGSRVLAKILKSGDTIAVAWGRTVLAVAEKMGSSQLQDVTVVQATGSTGASFAYTPEICAARLAQALGARIVPITAPAIVSSAELRGLILGEQLLREQFGQLSEANRVLFGISSLRPNSTIHTSGFFETVPVQDYLAKGAVGVIAGRFIDARGEPVIGPLDERTVGISLDNLRAIQTRMAISGGFDKVPALLAALRGGYINVLVTDAATGNGILRAEGVGPMEGRTFQKPATPASPTAYRTAVKKFLNNPNEVVEEVLDGAVRANSDFLMPIKGSQRALVARHGPRPGKVGLVIGGGSGHEPGFLGYVGRGLADAVAIGNIFSSPPPAPILECAFLHRVAQACCSSTATTPAT